MRRLSFVIVLLSSIYSVGSMAIAASVYSSAPPNTTGDLWEGATVIQISPMYGYPASLFNGSDLFGTTMGSFPNERGNVVFADTFPAGTLFNVEFRTTSPITFNTYDAFFIEDGSPSPAGSRSIQRFVLQAKTNGSDVYNKLITDTLITSVRPKMHFGLEFAEDCAKILLED